ncbi:DUF4879 domain-containing protein [Luteibacter sp. 3190]|uniref:DUF4879 domain-containing protein n=1 Tax=Luteibacter sp. 3190 TaxID=2817736 RepID=UPI002861CA1B|nr:DUF4879 domain-containing protein [Luteibacter sp. 3190]MDR6938222.1 hypothetical protein [Luteibacter sp. 3190]
MHNVSAAADVLRMENIAMKRNVSFAIGALALVACWSIAAQSFGGAAPVSDLYVASVSSQTGSTEAISVHQTATQRHHAGGFVHVVSVERGYGHASATMNNGPVREIETVNLCDGGRGSMVRCRNGQTVIGHMRTWDVTGKGNGQFTVKSTSVNWPRNTATKSISIL